MIENNKTEILSALGNCLLCGLSWLMSYTKLPVETTSILLTLMTLDIFVGIAAARRAGEEVTSSRMRSGILSKLIVLTIPIVISLTIKALGHEFIWLIDWSLSFLVLTEAYSVISNGYTVRTGEKLPEWDATTKILKKIRKAWEMFDVD